MITGIIVTIFIALILGLAITYYVNDFYRTHFELEKWEDLFYSQHFDPHKKKIYLIGSSQVHRLNATYIEKYISQIYQDYEVYNLGIPGDKPSKRINSLKEIIDTKPAMILYGIAFRDLQGSVQNQIQITDVIGAVKPVDILPEPWNLLYEIIPNKTIIDFSNFDNPQITTLKLFKILQNPNTISQITPDLPNTPFYKYKPENFEIKNFKSPMKKDYEKRERFISNQTRLSDPEVIAMKSIISTLKENNIQVILFSVPYPKISLYKLDDTDIEIFTSTLEEISDEFDVKVYHFYDKYADLNIWADPIHVSMNQKSIIYSSDMAKIILDEIKS